MVTHGSSGPLPLDLLPRQLAGWDTATRRGWERGREAVSTGFRPLDRLLPAGGVRRGSLIEWLAADDAAGAVSLACAVACRLAGSWATGDEPASATAATTILVVDRGGRFYPPAVLPWLDGAGNGMGSGRGRPQFVVARPSTDDDELWAIDQSLRCPGVAAVLAWPGRVHATAMRRWQLAARTSGAVGLLVRGVNARGMSVHGMGCGHLPDPMHARSMRAEPTWAEARVAVQPVAAASAAGVAVEGPAVRRLRLSLVGGPWAGDAMLEERSTELLLDTANCCEAVGCRRAAIVPGTVRMLHREGLLEGMECRAS